MVNRSGFWNSQNSVVAGFSSMPIFESDNRFLFTFVSCLSWAWKWFIAKISKASTSRLMLLLSPFWVVCDPTIENSTIPAYKVVIVCVPYCSSITHCYLLLLPASERFLRHVPSRFLCRSFSHLPFFTLGAGTELFITFLLFKFCYHWNKAQKLLKISK